MPASPQSKVLELNPEKTWLERKTERKIYVELDAHPNGGVPSLEVRLERFIESDDLGVRGPLDGTFLSIKRVVSAGSDGKGAQPESEMLLDGKEVEALFAIMDRLRPEFDAILAEERRRAPMRRLAVR